MSYLYPRHDKKARIIGDIGQMTLTLRGAPANETVAGCARPGGRAEHPARQYTAIDAVDNVLQVLARHISEPKVVMLSDPLKFLRSEPRYAGPTPERGCDSHSWISVDGGAIGSGRPALTAIIGNEAIALAHPPR